MSEQTEGAEVEAWAFQHHRETGHRTQETLTDPGSCLACSARSPMYDLPAAVVAARGAEGGS